MILENLTVRDLILHAVYRRRDDKQPIPPQYGQEVLTLDGDGLVVFRDRVVTALGRNSQSMEMLIVQNGADSAVAAAQALLVGDAAAFAQTSRRFADMLTHAQSSRDLPGGALIVFRGSAGAPARPIVGVIKAETDGGFQTTAGLGLQYLKDILLTRQTKLYKIGLFGYAGPVPKPALPQGWTAAVYDSLMTTSNRDAAAHYFYGQFLGCQLPVNGARLTKNFYNGTREFINQTDLAEEKKADLFTSLYTYLKVDQSPTIDLTTFSNQYFAPELNDAYAAFMGANNFLEHAVPKDTSEIQNKLKRRKLKFSRDVQISGPAEAFDQLVRIRTLEALDGVDGAADTWTEIVVRDRIRQQE